MGLIVVVLKEAAIAEHKLIVVRAREERGETVIARFWSGCLRKVSAGDIARSDGHL